MKTWLGFLVGLTVSLTAVLTVVRPGTTQDDRVTATPAAESARLAAAAAEPVMTTAVSAPSPARQEVEARAATPGPAAPAAAPTDVTPATPVTAGAVATATRPADPTATDTPSPIVPAAGATATTIAKPGDPATVMQAEPSPANREPASVVEATETPGDNGPPIAPDEAQSAAAPATRQWYAFWQPFGSELSARGFSARLERLTGLDYRVVRVDGGRYHVAFGYDDEAGRLASLDKIEAATGLRLDDRSL